MTHMTPLFAQSYPPTPEDGRLDNLDLVNISLVPVFFHRDNALLGQDLQVTGNDGRIDIATVAETEDVLKCLALTER